MTKVMHVITTLGPAGAETMLCRIATKMDSSRFRNEIVSLTGILDLAKPMEEVGVRVRTLNMKTVFPNPLLVLRLAQWIRESEADVIHTWMYHANFVGVLAARLAGGVPVVWGIHHNAFDPVVDKPRTILLNRACAALSHGKTPARIVFCSQSSLLVHKRLGYAPQKLQLIPNGFDLDEVKPDPAARASLRTELGLPQDALLAGIAARFHPHKDHQNFILAAQRLHQQRPEVHFVMCGLNIDRRNAQLLAWIEAAGLTRVCHLLGARKDMPRIFAGIDFATTASRSEAFPVVIGEAMASGVPCVVTNVGDCATIVGPTGMVVSPSDPEALSRAWRTLVDAGPAERYRLGTAARQRVRQYFSLPVTVARYEAVYLELAAGKTEASSAARAQRDLIDSSGLPHSENCCRMQTPAGE